MKKIILVIFISLFLHGCLEAVKITTKYAVPAITVAEGTYNATQMLDEREEFYLGRGVAVNILKSHKLLIDNSKTEYVDIVGQAVVMHSDEPETYGGYHFAILDSDEINAFACPGGIIFITRGLLGMLNSEEELAAVLAHEIAHVNNKDGMNSVETSRWTQLAAIIGSATSKVYGADGIGQVAGVFENSVNDIVKTLVVNGYTKQQEYAADEKAVRLLVASGYDGTAVSSVLSAYLMMEKEDHKGMFRTHPGAEERLTNLKSIKNLGLSSPPAEAKAFRKKRFDSAMRNLKNIPDRL